MHIVDADAHLVEGPELLATLLERFPEHVELRTDGAGEWGLHLEGRRYPQSVGPGAGVRPGDALCGHGIDPSTAAGVLADADREGIERMVLYPSLALAVPGLRDPALAVGFARAFNAHVAAWCRAGCGRLLGVAVVPLDWPEEAMTVLEDARARGLIAACLPPATHRYNLDHPDLDPLFALAAELDMPLGVHGAPGLHLPKIGVDRFERYVQALRELPVRPDDGHDGARERRCARAPPAPAGRVPRGRLRLGALVPRAPRRALREAPRRRPRWLGAPAARVPRARPDLRDLRARRGDAAGRARPPRRWLRDVRERLSPLGQRLPGELTEDPRAPGAR